jgi:hypothetical protein
MTKSVYDLRRLTLNLFPTDDVSFFLLRTLLLIAVMIEYRYN